MSTATVIITSRVLLREGIASLLQNTRYKVVACIATPEELTPESCPKGQPRLAIVGINLQNGNLDQAAESIRRLRSLLPDSKILLVAESNESVDLQRVLALAPDACIFSLSSRETLINALELTLLDQRVFVFAKSVVTTFKHDVEFTGLAESVRSNGPHDFGNGHNLPPRESQVLTSLAQGRSNKLIARVCQISEATVKVHLKAILRKTQARNRTQAAIWAIEHGFRAGSSGNSGAGVEGRHGVEANGYGGGANRHNVEGNGQGVQKDGPNITEPPPLAPLAQPPQSETIRSATSPQVPSSQVQTATRLRSTAPTSKQRQQTC
jgi:two-component system nitrate/nitrite response regulator NarL